MSNFIINLDRTPDRLDFMARQFVDLGLSFERVKAIDALCDPLPNGPRWRMLRQTEIACFLSHRDCWARIAAGAADYGCIFEDDVTLAPSAGEILRDGWAWPTGLDVVKLEAFPMPARLSRKILQSPAPFVIRRLHSLHLGAAGYAVSRQGAARLLRVFETGVLEPADTFLFSPHSPFFRGARIGQLLPALCIQTHFHGEARFQSTIAYQDPADRSIGRLPRIWRECRKLVDKFADRLDRDGRESLTVPFTG
jgi:glycosyl transferase family 25